MVGVVHDARADGDEAEHEHQRGAEPDEDRGAGQHHDPVAGDHEAGDGDGLQVESTPAPTDLAGRRHDVVPQLRDEHRLGVVGVALASAERWGACVIMTDVLMVWLVGARADEGGPQR